MPDVVIDLINQFRAERGLVELTPNTELAAAAKRHAADQPTSPPDIYIDYAGGRAASLTAWRMSKAEKFFTAISHSPDHKVWLEKPELREAGVGHASRNWVVFLGWPL